MRWKQAFWTLGVVAGVALGTGTSSPVWAQSPASGTQTAALNVVEAFEVEERDAGTFVRIEGSQVPTFSVFKLTEPLRLFIDISNSRLGEGATTQRINNGVISQVALIEFEDSVQSVTRVIIGFDQAAHYDVRTEGDDVVVFVDGAKRNRGESPVAAAGGSDAAASYASALADREARLTAATRELDSTRARLQAAEGEMASLRTRIDAARGEERQALSAKLGTKNDAIAAMKRDVSAREGELESLRGAVARLQVEQKAQRERIASLTTEAAQAQAERDRALGVAEAKEKETREAARRAESLEAKLSKSERSLDGVHQEKSELSKKLAVLTSRAADRAAEVDRKSQELERARLRQQELESQLAELNQGTGRDGAAPQTVARLEKERQAWGSKLSEREAELAKAREEASAAAAQLRSFDAQISERDAEIARLKKEIAQAQQTRAKEQDAARTADAERLAALQNAVTREKERVAAFEAARSEEQEEMGALRDRLRSMESKLAQASSAGPAGRAVAVDPIQNTVRGIKLETEAGRSRIVVDLDRPGHFQTLGGRDSRAVMILDGVDLPSGLEKTLSAGTQGGAVRFVSTFRDDKGRVHLEAELDGDSREVVHQDGNRLVWEFAPGQARPDDSVQGALATQTRPVDGDAFTAAPPGYPMVVTDPTEVSRVPGMSRKRLTIDLRSADIQNVLRLMAKEGGVNIVAGDDVSGTVTMRLRSVPLDEAFLTILQARGMGFEKRGNVLRVAPQSKLMAEEAARAEARRARAQNRPLEVFLLPVNYATASEMESQVSGLLSPRGSVAVDSRTNTLVIKDVPDNLAAIRMLVESLDAQVPQVLIEARIVETNDTFVQQLGIQWGGDVTFSQANGNPTGLIFPSVLGLAGGATDGQTPTAGTSETPNFAVNLPAPAGTGAGGALGLTLGSVGGGLNINLRLSALEAAGHAKIVSAPKILTLDNNEATISQGTSIPISVVSAAGVQTVFVDATLELAVRPHVTPDGNIQLKINASKNEPDFQNTGARGDPTIIRKTAETELLIRDGDTTVIGGIYTRNSGSSISAVPFFHKIPILGFFFRTRSESERRTELLIFITPKIVNRAASLGTMSAGSVNDSFEPAAAGGGQAQ